MRVVTSKLKGVEETIHNFIMIHNPPLYFITVDLILDKSETRLTFCSFTSACRNIVYENAILQKN